MIAIASPASPERIDLDAELIPLAGHDAADYRRDAKVAPYPRNRLYAILADLIDVDRTLIRFGAAAPAEIVARRRELLAQLDAERDKAADSFLSMFSLAIDRRPNEVAAMLTPFLAKLFGTTWDRITERLEALENAFAAELEAAR